MKRKTDFTIDLTEKYPTLKVEVSICKTRESYDRLRELFYYMGGNHSVPTFETEATFFGFDPPSPLGLILLQKGFTTATFIHELFHTARWYFKLVGKRINEDRDETFAHLLSDLVDGFEREYYYEGEK